MQVQVLFFSLVHILTHLELCLYSKRGKPLLFFRADTKPIQISTWKNYLNWKKASKMNGSTLNMLVIHLFSWCMQTRTTASEICPTERHPLKRLLTRFWSYLSTHSYGSSSYEKLGWFSPDIQPSFSAVVLAAAQFGSTWIHIPSYFANRIVIIRMYRHKVQPKKWEFQIKSNTWKLEFMYGKWKLGKEFSAAWIILYAHFKGAPE